MDHDAGRSGPYVGRVALLVATSDRHQEIRGRLILAGYRHPHQLPLHQWIDVASFLAVDEFPPDQRPRIRAVFGARTPGDYQRAVEAIEQYANEAGASSAPSGGGVSARSNRPTIRSATNLLDTVAESDEFFAGDADAKAARDRLRAQRESGEYTVAMARAEGDDSVIAVEPAAPEPEVDEIDEWLDLGGLPAAEAAEE